MNDSTNLTGKRRIIVGADGSDLSIGALRWAVGQGEMTGADVEVITGWDVPVTIIFVPTYTDDDYARDAAALLDHTVSVALESHPPRVRVTPRLIQDRPARALTEAAVGADMLVIGSHGQGELPGMHLGSVASYCVHHAPCPVLVFRGAHSGR